MKYLTKFLTFITIFALMLIPAAFGGSALATDGSPVPPPVTTDGPLHEENDTEVFFDDIMVDDDGNATAAPGEASIQEWSNTADALFAQWEKSGYPDDIGGVYYDSEYGMMGFLLVNPTQERIDELRAMFTDDAIFTPSAYSYNELRLAQDEINAIMGQGSGIYSTSVGWTGTDRRVHGFGESGKEFRLTVGVDLSVFDYYSEGFAALYGDRVIVEVSGPSLPQDDEDNIGLDSGMSGMIENSSDTGMSGITTTIVPIDISVALSGSAFLPAVSNASNNGFWLWAVLGIGLIGILLLLLRLRSRPVPAMQTANGGVVSTAPYAGKKQVVEAVRNSVMTPSDGLFEKINKKIDSQESA